MLWWLPSRPVASIELGHEEGLSDTLLRRASTFFCIERAAGKLFRADMTKTFIESEVGCTDGDTLTPSEIKSLRRAHNDDLELQENIHRELRRCGSDGNIEKKQAYLIMRTLAGARFS